MIYDKLFDWQKSVVDKFKDRQTFGLFLDMGLGKTVVSLGLAEANCCEKVIVITINSKALESEDIDGSWLWWAKKSNFQYRFLHKWSNVEQEPAEGPELLITNYESLFERNTTSTLKKYLVDFCAHCKNEKVAIIVDESHKLKDLKSKQTKAVFQLKRRLEVFEAHVFCYLLTGTPFTTGYIDVYSQLKFLGMPMTKGEFIDRYCLRGNVPGLLDWQQPIVGYKDVDSLYRLIHGYALTIKSEEIVDLPEQIFVDHMSPCSEAFKFETIERRNGKLIKDELARRKASTNIDYSEKRLFNNPFYRNLAYPSLSWLADTTGTFWLRSRQASIGFQGSESDSRWYDSSRIESLKKFLEDNKDNYVIFYNFTPELEVLYPMLVELGYNVDVYCGPIKSTHFYDEYCKQKQQNKLLMKNNVILANFASGSTGMNWQEYSKCIIFSLPLYKDYAQAIKRVHRIGQKETVIYHRFYQDNWLDKNMLKALNEQIQYSEDLFKADLQRISELTSE